MGRFALCFPWTSARSSPLVLYALAVRLAGRDRAARHEHRLAQGRSLAAAGTYPAAARAFTAAAHLAPGARARADALGRAAWAHAQSGRFRLALDMAETAAQLAAAEAAVGPLAQAKKVAGIVLGRLGREAQALPFLEHARELVRNTGSPSSEAEILHALATCKLRLRRDDEAEPDYVETIAILRGARGARGGVDPSELRASMMSIAFFI